MQLPQRPVYVNKFIVMYCGAAGAAATATPRCTSLVHKSTQNKDLCTAIRPFSGILMAKSAASRQSPVTVEALEGIGWLGGWFGGGAEEAAGHGFDR
jgi:hypothetical protein